MALLVGIVSFLLIHVEQIIGVFELTLIHTILPQLFFDETRFVSVGAAVRMTTFTSASNSEM